MISTNNNNCLHLLSLPEDDVEQEADEGEYNSQRGQDVVYNHKRQRLNTDILERCAVGRDGA